MSRQGSADARCKLRHAAPPATLLAPEKGADGASGDAACIGQAVMRQAPGSRRTCLGTTLASTSVPKLQQRWHAWIRVQWGRQEEWAQAGHRARRYITSHLCLRS